MSRKYFKLIAALFFIFTTLNLFNAEIKIKENVITDLDKVTLYDFIITEDEVIAEKIKSIDMGYSPIDNKENLVSGDYIKIKLKQSKIMKNEELESIVFPKNVVVKKIKKQSSHIIKEEITEEKKTDIVFVEKVVVSEEKIFLSDFMEIENIEMKEKMKKIVIGFSPKPGEEKSIKNDIIKLKMKQLGIVNIGEYDIPFEFKVTREHQQISKEEIMRIILDEVTQAYGNISYKTKIDETGIEDVIAPQGIFNIKIYSNPGESKKLGKLRFSCDVEINGDVFKKLIVSGETGIIKKVFIVKQDKARGTEFSEEMFEIKEVLFLSQNQLKEDVSPEIFKSKILKRSVKQGEILEESMFEKKKLFKKNDIVTAVAVLDGATVTSELKAMEDGFEGEQVSVVNSNSKKIINGVVQSDGTVLIILQK